MVDNVRIRADTPAHHTREAQARLSHLAADVDGAFVGGNSL